MYCGLRVELTLAKESDYPLSRRHPQEYLIPNFKLERPLAFIIITLLPILSNLECILDSFHFVPHDFHNFSALKFDFTNLVPTQQRLAHPPIQRFVWRHVDVGLITVVISNLYQC
ncbi:unnamed protein product [Cuscuta europaea]|uniref:Uncharacterized protein n=1 Tax=Cuscuta europaea TaxID=41803 RepID=A0A9P0ZG62_CUSEU|nr:unnamed protein product [Cuscuta europaea]